MNGPYALTPREREVVVLVANGKNNRQAARELGLRPSSVATHLQKISKKLGARNRAHVVRLALKYGELFLQDITPIHVPPEILRGHKEGSRMYPLSCPRVSREGESER